MHTRLAGIWRGGEAEGHPHVRAPRGHGRNPLYSLRRAPTLARRRPPKLAGMDAGPAGNDRGQWSGVRTARLAKRGDAARLAVMPVVLATAALCMSPSVHDGDTIRCGRERVRIANIDAPELADSPKCQDRRQSYAWCDFAAGEASRVALIRLLSRGRVMIERLGSDPYGRTLATVSVNGVDAGDYLIARGLAKPWR